MIEEQELATHIVSALEDMKALDIRLVDVRGQTSVTDWLVIASGTSSRHVKSLADHVMQELKQKQVILKRKTEVTSCKTRFTFKKINCPSNPSTPLLSFTNRQLDPVLSCPCLVSIKPNFSSNSKAYLFL